MTFVTQLQKHYVTTFVIN